MRDEPASRPFAGCVDAPNSVSFFVMAEAKREVQTARTVPAAVMLEFDFGEKKAPVG